jgi:large-conductance mechanosensitive channel|tara:strand:- start:1346 stop:1822 length:477 start_codon:yes stop_codon:yes gene_type:complete
MELIELFLTKFYKDFQEYTYKNKVLVAASGFAIGIATTNLLKSIIDDVISPNIIKLFSSLTLISPLAIKYPIIFNFIKNISNIIWLFIIWIITIFCSFFVIEYILNRKVIGLSSNVQDDEKKQFIKEKIISKDNNNILPNEKDKINIENDKMLEKLNE